MQRPTNAFRRLLLALSLLPAFLPAAAHALDYRSVSVPRAVLYDAPSAKGKKLFVVSQFYPVEVIVELGEWIKVRDKTGGLAWIESKDLAAKRTVVAVDHADVHETADAASSVVFKVDKDVALELVEAPANGWVKVKHRDGLTGYLPANQVWGI
ncbi:peroxiredoxin [Novimethylophilus kurashikiensis]|uniref:Peroxiredoxin n=1 Tax=Novimethylophilus kurashikiensis TaxID=1825523 RepID=A0A2R5FD08_9PROT|nr:SH3 domain-containing protein [Novimethylophilus kurashikiensis]GBG15438.1 peroxiredoxin [Novimethylophilus kurashikiensis]